MGNTEKKIPTDAVGAGSVGTDPTEQIVDAATEGLKVPEPIVEDPIVDAEVEKPVKKSKALYSKVVAPGQQWRGLVDDLEFAAEAGKHLLLGESFVISEKKNKDGSVTKEIRLKK